MATITIDGKKYDMDTLSDEAKAQIQSIQFVDSKVTQLQSELAVYQTARNAYVANLKGELPNE